MTANHLHTGCAPGTIGRMTELHGVYYHEHWGFGLFFEAKVAVELSAFLQRFDAARDGLWTLRAARRIEGAIAIDGIQADREGAHLRWFIVSEQLRGKGGGNRLIRTAVEFCRQKGYRRIFLWTFEGLHAARHLYEKNGFRLAAQHSGNRWGTQVNEQRFELQLTAFPENGGLPKTAGF